MDLYSTTPEEIVRKAQDVLKHRDKFRTRVSDKIKEVEELSFKNSRIAVDLLNRSCGNNNAIPFEPDTK